VKSICMPIDERDNSRRLPAARDTADMGDHIAKCRRELANIARPVAMSSPAKSSNTLIYEMQPASSLEIADIEPQRRVKCSAAKDDKARYQNRAISEKLLAASHSRD